MKTTDSGPSPNTPSHQRPFWVEVGKVLREWGVRGEVKCHSFNPESSLFVERSCLYLFDSKASEDEEPLKLEVLKVQPHGDDWRIHFVGYETPEAAKALRSKILAVPREELPPLASGETYLIDLLGLEVFSPSGEKCGSVLAFQNLGGSEGLVIGEQLDTAVPIPFREEFVAKIDWEKSKLSLTELGLELIKLTP